MPGVELSIVAGLPFYRSFSFREADQTTPIDVTGAAMSAHLRLYAEHPDAVGEFDLAIANGPEGVFTLSLSASQTLKLPPQTLVFDVIKDGQQLFGGTAYVTTVVTR